MFLPVSDENDHGHYRWINDFITYSIILICTGVLIYEISLGDNLRAFINQWSFNPSKYFSQDFPARPFIDKVQALFKMMADVENGVLLRMITSTFLHASLSHLFCNMWMFWITGDNVEYVMGHIRFFIFFVLCGILSECAHVLMIPSSMFYMGSIGASGAIFAVMGAYVCYFPSARINIFYWFFVYAGTFQVPAALVFVFYFIGDLLSGVDQHGGQYSQVAVLAHCGGFMFGYILARFFRGNMDTLAYKRSQINDARTRLQEKFKRKIKALPKRPDDKSDDFYA